MYDEIPDDDRLLPCPFCGGVAEICQDVEDEKSENFGGYYVCCLDCDASSTVIFAHGEDPIPILLERWNKRTMPSAFDE